MTCTQCTTLTNEKNALQTQVTNLTKEKNTLNTKVADLTKESDTLKNQVANLTKEKDDLSNKKNTLVEELKNEINKLMKEKELSIEQVNKITAEKNELKKKENDFGELVNQLNSQTNTLKEEKDDLLKSIKETETTLTSKIEELTVLLLEEKEKLRKYLDSHKIDETKEIYQFTKGDKNEIETFFDCKILADSFYSLLLNKSWPIQIKDWNSYQERSKEITSVISVLGAQKTGKSFVLGKVLDQMVPQGRVVKTSGLCALYPNQDGFPWTALDTSITNTPIRIEMMKKDLKGHFNDKGITDEKEIMKMLLADSNLVENLIQGFVIEYSQVVLIVVGRLNKEDQRLIEKIKPLKTKKVLIVHNLFDVLRKEDVDEIIQEDIKNTFHVQERSFYLDPLRLGAGSQKKNKKVYTEKGSSQIEHVVMAHEGSPAGEYFNDSAISYIRTVISTSQFSNEFDVVECLYKYIHDKIQRCLPSNEECKGVLGLEKEEQRPVSFKLLEIPKFNLKMIEELEEEGTKNKKAYTLKMVSEKKDEGTNDFLQLEFEAVGKCQDKNLEFQLFENEKGEVKIALKGLIEDDIEGKDEEKTLENTRNFGEFSIITKPVNIQGYAVNRGEKPKLLNKTSGLKILLWKLYKVETKFLDL